MTRQHFGICVPVLSAASTHMEQCLRRLCPGGAQKVILTHTVLHLVLFFT